MSNLDDLIVFDCEVYPNYFLVCLKNILDGRTITIEVVGKNNYLSDKSLIKLKTIISTRNTFGFNSLNYDLPIIFYALNKKTCSEICEMSNDIIRNNLISWQTIQNYNLIYPNNFNHFDLMQVAPSVGASLKIYGGRMHSNRLQDLPIEPNSILSNEDIENIKSYCINDLDTTIDLYGNIKDRIQLRSEMSKKYKIKLLSKSDAQIAETIIRCELKKLNFYQKFQPPTLKTGASFKYVAPTYINFKSEKIKKVFDFIQNHNFEIDDKGSIVLPDYLRKLKINLGRSNYQLGIGGIHSTEKKQTIIPTKNQLLIDKDVASYYPAIILNNNYFPSHLGRNFLKVYKKIVDQRLEAKKLKNKVVNESLKIVINGSFGKFGNKWSALYSPRLLMQVTLTGQLSLLMLIEELEEVGISVISANTDGFVSLVDANKHDEYQEICRKWEQITNFNLEENKYKALYSRDVNNYLAITENNNYKGKGIFTLGQLSKNPQGDISIIAVIELLRNGKSIEDTILNCEDVTKFIILRQVTGGATWRGGYLGKVVRWVYSKKGDIIEYKKNGNKVAKSDGAYPVMNLNNFDKNLIDYKKYIDEANDIVANLSNKQLNLF